MPLDNEPKALVADILSEIITYVKQSRPTRTDGTSTQGYVYMQLRPGQMISPRDFSRTWNPSGVSGSSAAPAPGAAPPVAGQIPPVTPATGPGTVAPKDAIARSIWAAFNTTQIVDTLSMVTDDSTLAAYAAGRHLSFVYPGILQAMEAVPPPPRSAEETARIDAARKVLWDADGNATPAYLRYKANQLAVSKARADFVINQNKILADPAQADSAPILMAPFQDAVDQAFDQWKSQAADVIETALATTESLGVSLEQGMIANARKLMDAWSLNLSGGVAVKTPFSYVLPSEWAAIEIDDIGWTTLEKNSTSYKSHFDSHGFDVSSGNWAGDSSSTSGSAGVSVFGFGFSGSHSESSSSSSSDFSQNSSDGSHMTNDVKELHIKMQYGLCEIIRPWLITDLFRMRSWFLRGEKAGVISDGTVANQVHKDVDKALLPMIPTHFIVIRNVEITASDWGSTRDTLTSQWGKQHAASEQDARSTGGSVDIPVLGPFSCSGGFSRSDSHYQGDFKDEGGNDCRDDSGAYFEGETLCIRGAQIVAWLGEIIPASPPLPDPTLASVAPVAEHT
jgi:hypothetical protein